MLFIVIESSATDKNAAIYSFLVVAPLSILGFPWNIGAIGLASIFNDLLPLAIVNMVAAIVLISCVFVNSYLIARLSSIPITKLAFFSMFLAVPFGVFLANG